MANDTTAVQTQAHPAPHRERVGLLALAFGVLAGPFAWGVRLVLNYGIASTACFPDNARRLPPRPEWLRTTLTSIELIAILVAATGALVSFRIWQSTRYESEGHAGHLIEAGEGRTRFLAVWGMITGVGFLLFNVFDLVAVMVLPKCG